MFQPDLHRNRTDDLAEACHLQILHTPDLDHQRAEFFAAKAHPPCPEVNAVKMAPGKSIPKGIVRRRKCVNQMKQIRQISPENFFFKRAEPERRSLSLLNR